MDSPFEIFDDLFIADSGSFLMLSGIIMFYIKQQQIKLRGQILKDIIRNITGSFNGSMDICFFKRNSSALRNQAEPFPLSGDRYAASGLFIKVNILKADFSDVICCFFFPFIAECLPRDSFGHKTGIRCSGHGQSECDLLSKKKPDLDMSEHRSGSAGISSGRKDICHLAQLGFRIGAPFAPKRTSFQKTVCPDSRSVVDAEFLYIKNNSFV